MLVVVTDPPQYATIDTAKHRTAGNAVLERVRDVIKLAPHSIADRRYTDQVSAFNILLRHAHLRQSTRVCDAQFRELRVTTDWNECVTPNTIGILSIRIGTG